MGRSSRKSVDRHLRPEVRHAGELALLPSEVPRLLESTVRSDDRALLALAISTGIRREDLVAIERAGVEVGGRGAAISYYESKKGRTRLVWVSGEAFVLLRSQLAALRGVRTRWVFPSRRGGGRGHLSGRAAWDVLDRSLRAASLAPRPFHSLRATCVKVAQARGWTAEQIASLTGDSVAVIQQHYSVPSRDEMRQVVQDRPII